MEPSKFKLSTELKILSRICAEVGTPVAYKAERLIAAERWVDLAKMKVKPGDYCQPEHYLRDAQVIAFLKKHPELPVGEDVAKQAAIDSFWAAEKLCYWSNERLNPLLSDIRHYGEGAARLVVEWRKEIRRILRKAPSKELLRGRFGPGSTFLNQENLITIADKLDENYSATRTCLKSFASVWDATAWSRYAAAGLDHEGTDLVFNHGELGYYANGTWSPRDFAVVGGNRFTVVPKTALAMRGICVEPSLNVYYQLGVGRAISQRLRWAYGWSKETVQQYHRWLARVGSLTGSNATIDLSSASDTICKNLVRLLLPRDWHDLLCQLRSPKTRIQGRWLHLEKFSSMGNGFTFELETLIFYSLATVLGRLHGVVEDFCPGSTTSVFGDDIIVPKMLGPHMVRALEFFGFSVNTDKTFLDGPFRESCGGDYFRGVNVRPYYVKEAINTPARTIAVINGLHRFERADINCSRYPLQAAWRPWLINRLPRAIRRCRGPEEFGDLVIQDDNCHTWDTITRNSIRYLRVWRPIFYQGVNLQGYFRPGVVGAVALYLAGSRRATTVDKALKPKEMLPSLDLASRRNGSYVRGYRFGRVAFS